MLINRWEKSIRPKVKQSTFSTYSTIVSKHLRPAFGDISISDVTSELVTDFLAQKSAGTPPLAPSTVHGIATVLRSILTFAAKEGYNLLFDIEATYQKSARSRAKTLNASEYERLEQQLYLEPTPIKLGILTCMYTGIRLGEICALKWGDISFETGSITVRRTVQRIKSLDDAPKKTTIIFDAPKSWSSNRLIPLPSFLLDYMKEFQKDADSFILTGQADTFIEPRTLQNHFKRILQAAGIQDINFHALRHTFATKCVDLGFDVKALSEILGHADVSMTLNTYVHPSVEVMRSFMERLQSAAASK
jgi:integrase